MPRPKRYPTVAARQQAYRARQRQILAGLAPPPPPKPAGRRLSRPKRVAALVAALRELADEYQDWREALPDSLAGSRVAAQLDDVTEQLGQLADDLEALDLPRGFGR